MTITIQQAKRRSECFLRMVPLNTDERIPAPRPTMRPETALNLCLSDTGFTLTLDELRSAWLIANDRDKPLIEAHANELKKVAA